MLNRITQRLRYWFNPIRCPECKLRCLSKPGLGRHLAAHRRCEAKWAANIEKLKTEMRADPGLPKPCGVSDCKLPMPHNHFQEAE